jgi:hypothetical protein
MLGGNGKGGRVGQRESPSGTEVSPCLRVANLQKIFFHIAAAEKKIERVAQRRYVVSRRRRLAAANASAR